MHTSGVKCETSVYRQPCGDCVRFDVQHCPCHARSKRDFAEWHTRVSPCMSDLLFICWHVNIRETANGFSQLFILIRIRILLVFVKNNGNFVTKFYVKVNCGTCNVNGARGAIFAAEIQVLVSAMFLLTFTQSSNLRSCGVIQWHYVRSRRLESREQAWMLQRFTSSDNCRMIYTSKHTYTHIHTQTHTRTQTHTHTHTNTHTHTHTNTHTHTHTQTRTHTHTNTRTHTHTHIHTHTHTNTHTHTHTHTHKHTHTHTHTHYNIGRIPLNEWSDSRRHLYLTTHNTHQRETSVPSVGFETATPASEPPQTKALDHKVAGIGL